MSHAACPTTPWTLANADERIVTHLRETAGVSEVTARILASRGMATADDVAAFLEPSLDREWLDPSRIPGMVSAAERVASAIREKRRVVVFGDFDLDGISAAAVATRGIRALGGDAHPFVPRRFGEGYGLTDAAIERMLGLEPELVITVDCGISAATEVDALVGRGIDVVVTDHHEPGDALPGGVPVADPKLDGTCGSADLAGAGVALKLVQATGGLVGDPDAWRLLTDLATLGTIADVVPLRGENRALVADGLRRMTERPRPGIEALADVAGVDVAALSSTSIAYGLAPRLNAAGRMADPAISLDLLMTDDPVAARELAGALDEHNRVRQSAEAELFEQAQEQAESSWTEGDRALVLAGEGWHEGVKGIVASRLVGLWGMPVVLFSLEDGEARGSGRSVGRVDLFAAVSACSDRLTRFGGHAGAVGLALPASDLDEFRTEFLAELATLPDESFHDPQIADAVVGLGELSHELAAELELLAPFGHGNPLPRFASCGVFMTARQRVGKTNDHLKFTAFDGTTTMPSIAFRARHIERLAERDAPVDLLYELDADEWRGVPRLQLIVREIHERDASLEAPAAELVEELFERADTILAREQYAGIEEAASFHTKLAGVTFEGRQEILARLEPGTPLRAERRPDNPHDENAIALLEPHGEAVGWFNRRLAEVMAPVLDAGVAYDVTVTDVTGGADRSFGVNVRVERRGADDDDADRATWRAARRAELAALDPDALHAELVRTFIGDRPLHAAQHEALERLAADDNTLCVMATGRGKSLIFHLHAAREALVSDAASVFVYPLRALVADQAYHLAEVFGAVGLSVRTVTGETSQTGRDEAFAAVASGELDVILTTPEFLDFHAARFADTGRIGFVVVDEAHHVGLARAGHRPSYARLGAALDAMGRPVVLAVTATADDGVTTTIRDTLSIDSLVLDPSVRENLRVVDERGTRDRDGYLAGLVARGEKTIAYVNSREQSVRIARTLRKRVPGAAMRVAFYNGGLTRSVRHAVERAFRDNELDCVVSTSAFGEGVNIPDIRNVVLYHLPFNDVEFNQMSGRAGRDGAEARIHLLFGPKDARLNELILGSLAPCRDDMAALYVALRDLQGERGPAFEVTNAELAGRATANRRGCLLDERGVSVALGILRELGLVEGEGYGAYRRLTLLPSPEGKVELETSVRYAEGLEEQAEFEAFRRFALESEAHVLLERFNRPILPTRV